MNSCYQAPSGHDMCSPQLMSPNQTSVPGAVSQAPANGLPPPGVNNIPLQRNIANSNFVYCESILFLVEMQPNTAPSVNSQHIRLVQQTSFFYGHDPSVAGNLQSDMCLVGCFFVVIEHEEVLLDRLDVMDVSATVRLHGGEIEFGTRAYNNVNSERVTHVICESMRHQLVQQAFKKGKRCVTLHWLNDVISKKHLEAPWCAYHLPTFWTDNHRPAYGKIICVNGFDEDEIPNIKMMIIAIGARYTPHFTAHNNYMISKTYDTEKFEECREMDIVIVTYQWLVDLYLGVKNSVSDDENYRPVPGMVTDINITPYKLELVSELCKQLLYAWKVPILFTNEQWQRALEVKKSVSSDENIFPTMRLRMTTPPPTNEEIEAHLSKIGPVTDDLPVVCFTGFPLEEEDCLARKVRFLGAKVTQNVSECTHLVVLNLWRTFELLVGVALGKNIVGFNWVNDGYRYRYFPDTYDYFARDEDSEKVFGYNLKYSVLRARHRKAFQGATFYLTPTVEPSREQLSTLIECAGGVVLKELPEPQYVIRCIETESLLLLISNESDVHLLQYLTDAGLPVFNAEIILTGVLRQKLENSSLYRITPSRPPLSSSQPQPAKGAENPASHRVASNRQPLQPLSAQAQTTRSAQHNVSHRVNS
ncbi:unnamed protein product [Thelazia callipaeda]|uniref:PAX-interacting protein 1 n=1 Tax=Thelazia callipaeda TaxID=103827 RepID=A0A0N5CWH1_THECL|nr:unnamed protein product [Thelazia callipaeda]